MDSRNFRSTRLIFSILVAAQFAAIAPATAQEQSTDPLQDRIGFVKKLLNESSAARQVKESDLQEAIGLREQAVRKYAQALEDHRSGDLDAVATDLSEAIKLMYAAVRAAKKDSGASGKTGRDFRNRRASVDALMTAHQKISDEKGLQHAHSQLRQEITEELKGADEKFENGDFVNARHQLDQAYDKVKISVEQLREGDTLVRELKFATSKDEYLYELDRNDTHKMLVTVLLEEKLGDQRVRERVASLISAARDLRATAETQAENNQYAKAIETLEKSTRELVQAIRGAGVYIPG